MSRLKRIRKRAGKIVTEFKKRIYPLHKALFFYLKNWKKKCKFIKEQDWKKYKTSDTIFVFGSGSSINDITEKQWKIIESHDSIGLNIAYLVKRPMTYYYLGYEPTSLDTIRNSFTQEYREVYKDSVWFLLKKCVYRLIHPRTTPELFPPDPKIALVDAPESIHFESDRPFKAEDFKRSIMYRSVLALGLHLVNKMGYKNIVLLGVDLHTHHHFYDKHKLMKEERKRFYSKYKPNITFNQLLPEKESKKRTMEEYYYALNELYFKPKGINLFVGNKNNMLSPRIKAYPGFFKKSK